MDAKEGPVVLVTPPGYAVIFAAINQTQPTGLRISFMSKGCEEDFKNTHLGQVHPDLLKLL